METQVVSQIFDLTPLIKGLLTLPLRDGRKTYISVLIENL